MSTILVTGSAGYVGAVLMPLLRAAGHQAIGLDMGYYFGSTLLHVPRPQINGDVRTHTVDYNVDTIIHMAALSNDPLGALDEKLTYDVNVGGTANMVEQAIQAGAKRFVLFSSPSVYGKADGDVTVSSATAPVTTYAKSKLQAEEILLRYQDKIEVIILRPGTVFGWSPAFRTDLVWNNLLAWGLIHRHVRVQSDGSPWRPLVHVFDLASHVTRIVGEASGAGGIEHVFSGNYQVRELADMAAEKLSSYVQYVGEHTDPRSYRLVGGLIGGTSPSQEREILYNLEAVSFQKHSLQMCSRVDWLKEQIAEGRLDQNLKWNW